MKDSPKHSQRPRVALLIESSRAYGRDLLLGVARYVREHGPWTVFLQERSLGDDSPRWLRHWEGDGIIARMENYQMAQTIRRSSPPRWVDGRPKGAIATRVRGTGRHRHAAFHRSAGHGGS